MAETPISQRGYLIVSGLLMLLLVATVGVAKVPLGVFSLAVAMAIAAIKAALVALYFMHLRFSTPLTRVFAAAGLLWLLIALVLTMADYLTRAEPMIGEVIRGGG